MIKKNVILSMLFLLPIYVFSQNVEDYYSVKTKTVDVNIPGKWDQLNTMDDSGQTYLKNKEGVIIAIAQNPKKSYSFFKGNKSDFENVKEFYKWDSDYMIENHFKVDKLKENSETEYIIWKYNDKKLDVKFHNVIDIS